MGDATDLIYKGKSEMVVKDHQGEPMKGEDGVMSIVFYGPDTEEQRRAYRKHRTAIIKADGDAEKELDAECELLFQLTKEVKNIFFRDKEAFLNDMKVMYHDVLAIRAQAFYFVEKHENFIKELKQN